MTDTKTTPCVPCDEAGFCVQDGACLDAGHSQTKTTATETLPDAYYEQLRRTYEQAKEDLARAAAEGRAAQARWEAAVDREMDTHRRYRDAIATRMGVKL